MAVAVTWSVASHWILGVPFDVIFRAKRFGGEAAEDLELMVAVNVRRLNFILNMAGLWLVGFVAFVLSILATVGFFYGVQMAQGLFMIFLPLTIVGIMTQRKAIAYGIDQPTGDALIKDLMRFRYWIQVVALPSIFLTAMYGMYHILSLPIGY